VRRKRERWQFTSISLSKVENLKIYLTCLLVTCRNQKKENEKKKNEEESLNKEGIYTSGEICRSNLCTYIQQDICTGQYNCPPILYCWNTNLNPTRTENSTGSSMCKHTGRRRWWDQTSQILRIVRIGSGLLPRLLLWWLLSSSS
jgi:hypothetical protein